MPRRKAAVALSAAVESYLLALDAENRAAKTLRTYRTALDRLMAGVDATTIDALGPEALRGLLVRLRDEGRTPATRRTYAAIWAAFCGWLVEEGLLASSPMARVKLPSLPTTEPPGFSAEEVQRLLAVCDTATLAGARDAALITVLVATGLRLEELLQLRREDVVQATVGAALLRVLGKGSKERQVALQRPAAAAVRRYLLLRGEDDVPALWLGERGPLGARGVYQMVRRRGVQAGIAGVHPHRFRNAALGMMSDAGIPEADIQRIAGHSSPAMTRHYTAFSAMSRANAALLEVSPLERAGIGASAKKRHVSERRR